MAEDARELGHCPRCGKPLSLGTLFKGTFLYTSRDKADTVACEYCWYHGPLEKPKESEQLSKPRTQGEQEVEARPPA